MGGQDASYGYLNDVWYSADGITWTQATASAAWDPRYNFSTAVFNGQLWVLGGYTGSGISNDVWSSTDGITWTQATAAAAWAARAYFSTAVFDDRMWVLGGDTGWSGPGALNDVWSAEVQAGIDHFVFCWDTVAGGCTFTADSPTDSFTHTTPLALGTWYAKVKTVDTNGQESAFSDNGSVWIFANAAPGTPTTTTPTTDTTPTWTWTPGTDGPTGALWEQIASSAPWAGRSGFTAAVFNNQLWVLGGSSNSGLLNDVWSSSDGITWTQVTAAAAWDARYGFGVETFNDQLWIMGGTNNGSMALNDVWSSSDGITWTQVTASAAWEPRTSFNAAAFDGRMWVLGGQSAASLNDVWSSTDGITWTQATAAAEWAGRSGFGTVVLNNQLWVLGGYASGGIVNDVWSSSDGITWTQVTAAAEWAGRSMFGAAAFSNQLWVFGGQDESYSYLDDVWYSADGITWTQATAAADWGARVGFGTAVFNDQLWVLGGSDASYNYLNDVWTAENLNIDHYDFCWATVAGNCTFTSSPTDATFTHTAPLALGAWYAKVRTVWGNGDTSPYSGNGSVVIEALPGVPGTPTTTSPTTDTTPTWTWTASTGNVDHYTVCWSQTAGGCTFTADTPTNSFTHITPLADGTWYFKVQAVAPDSSTSAFSDNGSVVIDAAGPTVPGTPGAPSPTTNTTPTLTWTASTDSASGLRPTDPYEIQWSQDPNFISGVTSDFSDTNSFTTPPLGTGTWYFRVRAFDALDQASAFSSIGSVVIESVSPTPDGTGSAADRGAAAGYATELPQSGPPLPLLPLTWAVASLGYLGLRRQRRRSLESE